MKEGVSVSLYLRAADLSIFGKKLGERLVSNGINSRFRQFFLQFRVPVVLDVVVCSSR